MINVSVKCTCLLSKLFNLILESVANDWHFNNAIMESLINQSINQLFNQSMVFLDGNNR